ncbi:hypothetical protein PQX77_011171 [Marasmius sp. AFHP31]|nr:hypothetical protein PQX77_011171 [Marasmius sp. AFHP31]
MSLLLAALSYRQLGPDSTAPTPSPSSKTRTTADIIWSCLSMRTALSGHWVLVYWDKTKIFLTALLAPELIVLWSIRQWFAARRMAKAYKQYGWTLTHAFFALMGGFALYDPEGNFLFHLWDDRFCQHHKSDEGWDGFDKQQRKLEELDPHGHDQYKSLLEYCVANKLITMTEEEIQGLGHTALLAKAIAIFQSLHFITNCVARGVDGLAITELEFFTLGFAALNLVSYSFWWYKPAGVLFPVRIMDRSKSNSLEQSLVAQDGDEESNSTVRLGTDTPGILSALWDRIRNDYIDGCSEDEWNNYDLGHKTLRILRVPPKIVWQTIGYAFNADSLDRPYPQPERGNIFSAGIADTEAQLPVNLMVFAAVILGVFHCIPIMLNYHDFPGHTIDHRLWTAFALAITGLPLGLWIMHFWNFSGKGDQNVLVYLVFLSTVLLYPIARIALMVLAVKQLTDLTSSALQQVGWTNLIPHFGI